MKNHHLKVSKDTLIDQLIKDDALSSGRSESEIINNIILNHYVDPYWYPTIKIVYDRDLSIGQFLTLIWMNTDYIGNKDMSNIVKYAAEASKHCPSDMPNPSHPEWHHFCSLLESLKLYIEYESKKSESIELDRTASMLTDIIESYKRGDVQVGLSVIYQIILDNFIFLQDKGKVYNLMQSMTELLNENGWQNRPPDRIELLYCLKQNDNKS